MREKRDECGATPECQGGGNGIPSLLFCRCAYLHGIIGAAVAERLDCSPPTEANRVQSPAGSRQDFSKRESFQTIPLVSGYIENIYKASLHGGYWLLLRATRIYSTEQAPAYLATLHHMALEGGPYRIISAAGDADTRTSCSTVDASSGCFILIGYSSSHRSVVKTALSIYPNKIPRPSHQLNWPKGIKAARGKKGWQGGRRHGGNTARLARRSDEALEVRVSVARIAPSLLDLGCMHSTIKEIKQAGFEPRASRTPDRERTNRLRHGRSARGGGSGRSLRRPADQRHRLARFPHEKIRSDPARWLDHSTPTKASRVRFPAGPLLDSHVWESCRTMRLAGGLSRESPASPRPGIPALIHNHLASPSSALKTTMLKKCSLYRKPIYPKLMLQTRPPIAYGTRILGFESRMAGWKSLKNNGGGWREAVGSAQESSLQPSPGQRCQRFIYALRVGWTRASSQGQEERERYGRH
ncbi:hypothetical protein PR048_033598 [Dryococelus australis]|uniref:Uncharacterized protein n=1 Tax=Dryococelus australis TaxID=614101 RepID=A0ABQ9G0R2_9NEOP|nr:hypothetical protein PR048_033598 [Dryococelus australis]